MPSSSAGGRSLVVQGRVGEPERRPAATPTISMLNSTQRVGHAVAAQTPAAGPIMKDSSTATESSEMAVRRSSSGTAAMTA